MKNKQIIWWHGTNKESAEKILKTGFKKRTYFARHLEDAIEFGGTYVFQVRIEFINSRGGWQVCCANKVSVKHIENLRKYSYRTLKALKLHESQKALL